MRQLLFSVAVCVAALAGCNKTEDKTGSKPGRSADTARSTASATGAKATASAPVATAAATATTENFLVTLDIQVGSGLAGRIVVSGTTNLPDGTTLMVSFAEEKWAKADPELSNNFYYQDAKVFVAGGSFMNVFLGPRQGAYPPGKYLADVLMPIPWVQTDQVRHIIGEKGERLHGPLVRREGNVTVEAKRWVTLPLPPSNQAPSNPVLRFLDVVAKYRRSPNHAPGATPCNEDECFISVDPSDESDPSVDVQYFRNHPVAVRFTIHFGNQVSCHDLGAVTAGSWEERPGLAGAAGEECTFAVGSLKGLKVVIEHNETNDGVHVYSPEYVLRNVSFAHALQQNRDGALR